MSASGPQPTWRGYVPMSANRTKADVIALVGKSGFDPSET
jgi:hypothetical protein